jgi:hypothetical protein
MTKFITDLPEVEEICKQYKILDGKWDLKDGKVNVIGDVYPNSVDNDTLQIQFGRVTGSFYLSGSKYSSLIGSPDWLGGSFYASGISTLTSLEGCPKTVMGNFDIGVTRVVTLEHSPLIVHGWYNASNCNFLESIIGVKKIGDMFALINTPKFINILEIFKVKGINTVKVGNKTIDNLIKEFLPSKDMIGFQDAMIDAGYEQFVRSNSKKTFIPESVKKEEDETNMQQFYIEMEKIENSLKSYGIYNSHVYWNKSERAFNVDVNGNVDLKHTSFKKIPWKFGTIKGNLNLRESRNLQTLENAPHTLEGSLDCGNCYDLISLEGCPKEVNDLLIFSTGIKNLEGGPEEVLGYLHIGTCKNLENFKGGPKRVGTVYASDNPSITSLEGFPEHVEHNVDLQGCDNLTTTKGIKYVGGYLNIARSEKLQKFEDITHVDGVIVMWAANIKNLLYVFKIKGLKRIIHSSDKVTEIVNNHLKTRDVIGCQDELIEAGLEEYARTK